MVKLGVREVKKLTYDHTANKRQNQPLGLSDLSPHALCHLPMCQTVKPVPDISHPETFQLKPQLTSDAQGLGQAESGADLCVNGPFLLREGPRNLWFSSESGGDSGPSSGLDEELPQEAPSFKGQLALSQAPQHQGQWC